MVGEDHHLSAANQVLSAEWATADARPLRAGPASSPPLSASGPNSAAEYPSRRRRLFARALDDQPAAGTATTAPATLAGPRGADADADATPDTATGSPPEPSAGPRRPARTRDRSFLAWGLASYAVVLAVVLLLALRETGGHLVYVLDDPAIHQAVATNLVENGTWGVDPGHFESASSSPLWTVLLGAYVALAPVGEAAGPLLLNAASAVAVIAVLGANQVALRPSRRRKADAVAVAALVSIVLFLPGLTLVGMEHALHMALVLGAVVLFHRQGLGELGRWPRWLPYLLLLLATLARLETVFVAGGLAVGLLSRCLPGWGTGGPDGRAAPLRPQLGKVALVGAATAVPVAGVVAMTRLMGQGWLPNSVIAKSRVDSGITPLYRAVTERFTADPLVGVVTAALAVALVLTWRLPRRFAFPAVVTVVTVAGHIALARMGWYERYQAYLIVLAAYAVLQLVTDLAADSLPAGWRARPAVGALAVFVLLPFCGTKLFLTVDAPLATADTYEQRYQAGRFLARYYDEQPVATGELGYVSVLHDGPITDMFGLGDYDVLRQRLAAGPQPPAEYWDRLADERGFEVAAVYPSTLGEETPEDWLLAGWWVLPRRTVSAFEPRFEFWATSPEALLELQDNLEAFADDLPAGVEFTLNEPATAEAITMMATPPS